MLVTEVTEAVKGPDDGPFISLWALFAQIGKAEAAYIEEAARHLVSCLDNDPSGMSYLRRKDELGLVLPLDMGSRLHLLRQLSIFASQGTLFDADDRPCDDAQAMFEHVGCYKADIYPYLARHDIAVSLMDEGCDDGSNWMLAYENQALISRSRAVKILLSSNGIVEYSPSQEYDDSFFKWDAALVEAIERGAIATVSESGKQMLVHADIRAWCAQHGHVWPFDAPETSDVTLSGSSDNNKNGLKKREQQVRLIEEMADRLGYSRQQIPDGGKAEIRNLCKSQRPDLFGGGDSPFDAAWKAARKAVRITMANQDKFTGK